MVKHFRLLIIVVVLAGLFTVWDLVYVKDTPSEKAALQPVSYAAEEPAPTKLEQLHEEIKSPDGKSTLIVDHKKNPDATIKQTFFYQRGDEEIGEEVYTVDSPREHLVSVPFNTLSPNGKFLFLKNNTEVPTHIVIRTDGKNIAQDDKYAEVETRFYEKYPEYTVTDVTGWGGYSLLVVNVDDKDGNTGPSFWFDLSNLSFIRLSTRFN